MKTRHLLAAATLALLGLGTITTTAGAVVFVAPPPSTTGTTTCNIASGDLNSFAVSCDNLPTSLWTDNLTGTNDEFVIAIEANNLVYQLVLRWAPPNTTMAPITAFNAVENYSGSTTAEQYPVGTTATSFDLINGCGTFNIPHMPYAGTGQNTSSNYNLCQGTSYGTLDAVGLNSTTQANGGSCTDWQGSNYTTPPCTITIDTPWGTTTAPDPLQQTTPTGSPAGCNLTALEAPDTTLTAPTPASGQPNTQYELSATISNGSDMIVALDPQTVPTTTTTLYGDTFGATGDNGVGTIVGRIQSLSGLGSPVIIPFSPLPGNNLNPDLWCNYGASATSNGTWINWGLVSQLSTTTAQGTGAGGTGIREASCYQSLGGWSLLNPVMWVVGGLRDLGCLIKTYAIPTSSELNTAPLTTALEYHQPFSFVIGGFNAVSTVSSQISTAMATGACTPPEVQPFSAGGLHHVGSTYTAFTIALPVPSDLGCTGTDSTTAGDLFGYRSLIRNILTVVLIATAIVTGWRMAPWSKPGDAVTILESYGTLNLDGDYIETFQTNEGSD